VASGTIHAWSGALPFISRIQKQDGDNNADVENISIDIGGDGYKKEDKVEIDSSLARADDGDATRGSLLEVVEIEAKIDGDGEVEVDDQSDSEQVELDALTAFAWGISCGTASCATLRNSVFDLEVAQTLYSQLTIELLS